MKHTFVKCYIIIIDFDTERITKTHYFVEYTSASKSTKERRNIRKGCRMGRSDKVSLWYVA